MGQQTPRAAKPGKSPHRALLSSALETAANAIFIADDDGRIVWSNAAFSALSGYSREELFGATPAILKSGMQSDAFYANLWQTILSGKVWRGILIERRKDGTPYIVDETITPLLDRDGAISHFISIQQDVTLRQQGQEREHYLAYHDQLTGLANRTLFVDLLQQAMQQAARARRLVALLFMDLDRFKPVNDRLGHATGDLLLQAVADRLRAAVRKSDTVARFGGDEFAMLLPDLADAEAAVALAGKLVAAIAQPFVIEQHRIGIGASVGIAIYPTDGVALEELFAKADQAMYRAKEQGGSSWRFYRSMH